MRRQPLFQQALLALALMGLAIASAAQAATIVIVDDPFADNGRTNGADPLDIQWYELRNSTLTIASDAVLDSGNALVIDTTGTFNRIVGILGSGVTIAEGQTLQLSFDYRFTQTPANSGETVRIGLFNNGGTPFTADNQTSLETNDFGYGFATNPGLASATGTNIASESAGDNILGGSPNGFSAIGTNGASVASTTTSAHSAVLSLTRNLDGSLGLSASIDGGTAATASVVSPATFTFHEIGFGQGNISTDYRIDNVRLTLIPEPSSLVLAALGLLALIGVGRRRRR